MARKSAGETRFDNLNQYAKRKYKKKKSPSGRKERSWTERLFEELQKGADENEETK